MQADGFNRVLEQTVRAAVRASGGKLSEFARQAKIPYGTMRGYVSGARQPGTEHLEKLRAAGVDVSGVMAGKVRLPMDAGEGWDWPLMEGSHKVNRLLAMMYLLDFQAALLRRILEKSDAFVAEYHRDHPDRHLTCTEFRAVMIACFRYAKDRLRDLSTRIDPDRFAVWTFDEIADTLLAPMPKSEFEYAIQIVRELSGSGQ